MGKISKLDLCILHIGIPKTGTTAVQAFLRANTEELANQGLKIRIGEDRNNADFVAFFQKNLGIWAYRRNIETHQQKKKYFRSFGKNFELEMQSSSIGSIRKKRGLTYCISSEHFSSNLTTPAEIKKIKRIPQQALQADQINMLCEATGRAGCLSLLTRPQKFSNP